MSNVKYRGNNACTASEKTTAKTINAVLRLKGIENSLKNRYKVLESEKAQQKSGSVLMINFTIEDLLFQTLIDIPNRPCSLKKR